MIRIPKINDAWTMTEFWGFYSNDIYGTETLYMPGSQAAIYSTWSWDIDALILTVNPPHPNFMEYHHPTAVGSNEEFLGSGFGGTEYLFAQEGIRIWEGNGGIYISYEIIPEPASSVILGVILVIGAMGLFIRKVLKCL